MSAKTKSASTKSKRVRRSPEAARQLILSTAADRLANMGLTGLNISGVAEAAGMSHATVIHHFGSTTAMRQALLSYMTTALLTDVREALARQDSPDQVLAGLFEKLSTNNHGRLAAWLTLEHQDVTISEAIDDSNNSVEALFSGIIEAISDGEGATPAACQEARLRVFLIATAAMGLGVCGDSLANLIGLTDNDLSLFPRWLAGTMQPTT
ncbi:MAG: hypothetical protein CMP98_05340 [Gammaproteobacteria bacterium]|nr:hypothetical protein [Gammaproteobacteria bacterium]OUU10307.1 MAG: hypothetical protein CBB94_05495 [Gammaproteobacteria bacterium TMED34]